MTDALDLAGDQFVKPITMRYRDLRRRLRLVQRSPVDQLSWPQVAAQAGVAIAAPVSYLWRRRPIRQ